MHSDVTLGRLLRRGTAIRLGGPGISPVGRPFVEPTPTATRVGPGTFLDLDPELADESLSGGLGLEALASLCAVVQAPPDLKGSVTRRANSHGGHYESPQVAGTSLVWRSRSRTRAPSRARRTLAV